MEKVLIIANAISILVIYTFVDTFFIIKEKHKNKEKFIYLGYFAISTPIIYFRNPNINMIISIILLLAITQFYQGTIAKKISITVLTYSTLMIVEGSIYNIINANANINFILENGSWLIAGNIILLIWGINSRKYLKPYTTSKENENINYYLMTIIPIGSIIILFFTLKENYKSAAVAPIALSLLTINIASYLTLGYTLKITKEAHKIKILEMKNKSYHNELNLREEKETKIKRLKHDMSNHILTIQKLLEEKSYKDLLEYVEEYKIEINKSEIFANTGDISLDNIINHKLNKALLLGTKIEVDIKIKNKIGISTFDIITIMGNILDNAVEAVEDAKDKQIYLLIQQKEGLVRIMAKNTFKGERNITNGKIETQKNNKKSHGIGLINIETVLKKYDGKKDIFIDSNGLFTIDASMYEE